MSQTSMNPAPLHCEDFGLDELEAAAGGRLPEEQFLILADHLEACPTCRVTVDRLFTEKALSVGRSDPPDVSDQRMDNLVSRLDLPPPVLEAFKEGEFIGPYQVVSFIGKGGSSTVYECVDHQMGRRVAVKVFSHPLSHDSHPARQEREARVLAQLDHPAIVKAYEIKPYHFPAYMVMDSFQAAPRACF